MKQYPNIQWVVQRNLTSPGNFEDLQSACNVLNIPFVAIDIIPFASSLPAFSRERASILYGSTTFNYLATQDEDLRKGIFFDEISFSIENYISKWGQHMLNGDATITTFKELIESNKYPADKQLFIRPNDDSKSFAGEVKAFGEIARWYEQLKAVENTNLTPDSPIVAGEPYNIAAEWRLWIVNKEVVAASKYREYFRLKKEEGCPDPVKAFAEARCREYAPHDVFVMDICLCGDTYYIVECGSMNGAGFYNARIEDIVEAVSGYFVGVV
ncbi:ATP-grasp domain-containing protein [uncultured Chitinophaga sp.]|uniref:ATP-grasp domain-containing protein n=1 Tax=uncultured Chitinophaga sp. TaxID=339340 RepID=UPI0025D3BD13|nr:ATP-grasp domain-containing protein [uncultured Chitinophaga sp.]